MQVAANIERYTQSGVIQFNKLLEISLFDRIPNLTHVYGFQQIHALLTVLLTAFCDTFNVIRPMSDKQIVSCANEMVMTSQLDQLSIEDYVLFFNEAKQGKYGKVLDRLDQTIIFLMLEQFRNERHQTYQEIKDEQHINNKALGPTERTCDEVDERDKQREALSEHLKHLYKDEKL